MLGHTQHASDIRLEVPAAHGQEMAKSRALELKGVRSCKMLVLNEVDRLSREAQHSLRRTMEKYSASTRLIMSANNVSKVICASELVPSCEGLDIHRSSRAGNSAKACYSGARGIGCM